jgi:hypothetical protein
VRCDAAAGRAYGWYQRELEGPRQRVAIRTGELDDRIGFLQQAAGALNDACAGRGQRDTLRLALDERYAQVLLEFADLRRQRWLADARSSGRPAEMPLVSERDQIAEVPEIHDVDDR